MVRATQTPTTKPEVYEALREGEITKEEAREFFGGEWEDVEQLERVEKILRTQPEPEADDSELYR